MGDIKQLRNAVAILSIILIGSGIAFIAIRRARSLEIGIILLLLGIILFYFRYFSGMMKDEPKIKIIDVDYKQK